MSSWWAIQASVRPWRTQARIWFSCERSGFPAMSGFRAICARSARDARGTVLEASVSAGQPSGCRWRF